MTFTGEEDHNIPLELASKWTKNYRNANPNQILAHYFGRNAITEILNQADCVGIRIYYALKDSGEKQVIICGVNGNGDDLYLGKLADRSYNCPPQCSTANPLNS